MDPERLKVRLGRLPECAPGEFSGWRLDSARLPGMSPARASLTSRPLPGTERRSLYAVTEEELETLDRYEGVRGGRYRRCPVKVRRRDTGEAVAAVTYVAGPAWVRDGLRPTRAYLNHLRPGPQTYGSRSRATSWFSPALTATFCVTAGRSSAAVWEGNDYLRVELITCM